MININLSRQELIELVIKILDPSYDENQRVRWETQLGRNVPHPEVSDLIYWPDLHGYPELTPEEIADIALRYKPICL